MRLCIQYKLFACTDQTFFFCVTVLASENNKSPFIGFILSGECHVLRWLEVLHGNKSDKKVRNTLFFIFNHCDLGQTLCSWNWAANPVSWMQCKSVCLAMQERYMEADFPLSTLYLVPNFYLGELTHDGNRNWIQRL